jgi:hypothetical protein
MTGAAVAMARRRRGGELGHVGAEVATGEGQVAGFFGDVAAQDPLEERVDPAVAAEEGALHIVDRFLAAEHKHAAGHAGPVHPS